MVRLTRVSLIVFVLLSSACDRAAPPTSVASVADAEFAINGSNAFQIPPHYTTDDEFAQLANVVPGGFGGWYFDPDGNLTILLKSPGLAPQAVAFLWPTLLERRFSLRGGMLRREAILVRRGEYDLAQLMQYRMILRSVFAVDGVTGVGIYHHLNRLGVEVENAGSVRQVELMLARLGIPNEMVIIRQMPPSSRCRRPCAIHSGHFRLVSRLE